MYRMSHPVVIHRKTFLVSPYRRISTPHERLLPLLSPPISPLLSPPVAPFVSGSGRRGSEMRGRGERLPPSFFLSHFSFPFIPALFLGSYCPSAGTTTPTQCPAGSSARSPPLPVTPQLAHRASKWKVGQEMKSKGRKRKPRSSSLSHFSSPFSPCTVSRILLPGRKRPHPHRALLGLSRAFSCTCVAGVDTVERTN